MVDQAIYKIRLNISSGAKLYIRGPTVLEDRQNDFLYGGRCFLPDQASSMKTSLRIYLLTSKYILSTLDGKLFIFIKKGRPDVLRTCDFFKIFFFLGNGLYLISDRRKYISFGVGCVLSSVFDLD